MFYAVNAADGEVVLVRAGTDGTRSLISDRRMVNEAVPSSTGSSLIPINTAITSNAPTLNRSDPPWIMLE